MSREIKFRVWDKAYKDEFSPRVDGRMIESNIWRVVNNEPTLLVSEIFNDATNARDLVIMQYTGLKDKHGVEIYEGDIVENYSFTGEMLSRYEIRWGQFGFTMFDPNWPDLLSYYISPDKLTVVGNVYEQPNMMKVVK